jgi:general secretion pathway protein E
MGHLFLSSVHVRDAVAAITALRNFGLQDFEIAASLDLIVAQRLVRRLCPKCRPR